MVNGDRSIINGQKALANLYRFKGLGSGRHGDRVSAARRNELFLSEFVPRCANSPTRLMRAA
jgi:hypothetical protein